MSGPYIKFLTARPDGVLVSPYKQDTTWDGLLPTEHDDGSWTPGPWTEPIPVPEPCYRGWHAATIDGVNEWGRDHAFAAEVRGVVVQMGNKVAAEQLRLLYRLKAWDRDADPSILLEAMHEVRRHLYREKRKFDVTIEVVEGMIARGTYDIEDGQYMAAVAAEGYRTRQAQYWSLSFALKLLPPAINYRTYWHPMKVRDFVPSLRSLAYTTFISPVKRDCLTPLALKMLGFSGPPIIREREEEAA